MPRALAQTAFDRLDSLNMIFSDYKPHSELNRVLRDAKPNEWVELSEDLWLVLVYAQEVSEMTNGAFDITVGPLSKLWRKAFRRQEFPAEDEVRRAMENVGNDKLEVDWFKHRMKVSEAGMAFDAGGIAKGYALEMMAEQLVLNEVPIFLIDGGGDLVLGMAPPDKDGWRVELPSGEIRFLEETAVATSGDKYHYLEHDGQRYSHIVDPRTGYGVQHGETVTVLSESPTTADVWATALSVMDQTERTEVLERDVEDIDEIFIFLRE